MKNLSRPFSLFVILLFAFSLVRCAGPGPGKKTIVLLVNTADIRPGVNPKEFCRFADQNGDIAQYTTEVFPGDTVVWIGVTNDIELEVDIEQIIHRGGPSVLGPTRGANGKVEGKIKNNAEPQQEETYAIKFTVSNQPNPFILDPVLRVH